MGSGTDGGRAWCCPGLVALRDRPRRRQRRLRVPFRRTSTAWPGRARPGGGPDDGLTAVDDRLRPIVQGSLGPRGLEAVALEAEGDEDRLPVDPEVQGAGADEQHSRDDLDLAVVASQEAHHRVLTCACEHREQDQRQSEAKTEDEERRERADGLRGTHRDGQGDDEEGTGAGQRDGSQEPVTF